MFTWLVLQVMALPKEVAEAVLGTALQPLLQQRMAGRNNLKKSQVAKPQIEYQDLEMHRIVGTGQFGMVRVVRHIPTNQAYALKVWSDDNLHGPQLCVVRPVSLEMQSIVLTAGFGSGCCICAHSKMP